MSIELKDKPLVEAILDIKWKLQGAPPGPQIDPHYKLLLGRLFDRMLKDYPEHEQLPAANFPDELVGHVVQHRFRIAQNAWPLVQIGPGVFTLNSTDDYTWSDFRSRAISAFGKLYDAHPKVDDLIITNMTLRYIDAVDYDFINENVLEFLKEKLKVGLTLPESLFEDTGVDNKPSSFTSQCSYKCIKPKGKINIRFATGQKSGRSAVIWETTIETTEEDLPALPQNFEIWLDEAHAITDDWFFKLIDGDLRRRFSGE